MEVSAMPYLRAIRQPRLRWSQPGECATEPRPGARRVGRRVQLERRHPALAGRRVQRHRTPFPMTRLADDVARLRQLLARQHGPTVVAGHSYGGQIITALGTDAPNVVGLVYIAAFGLDEGESIGELLAQGPPTPALAHLDVDQQGFAWLPEDDFVDHFAADVDPVKARVMHAVQQPLAGSALQDVMGVPAWNRCRPGTWSPTATRRSRPMPSACSPTAWARPPSKSRRTTWRWSPTPMRW